MMLHEMQDSLLAWPAGALLAASAQLGGRESPCKKGHIMLRNIIVTILKVIVLVIMTIVTKVIT